MAIIHPNEEPHSPSPWEREWGSRNRDWDKDYALIFSTGTPFLLWKLNALNKFFCSSLDLRFKHAPNPKLLNFLFSLNWQETKNGLNMISMKIIEYKHPQAPYGDDLFKGKQDGLTCIYEIMSITTPQAPYGDNFQSGVGMAIIHPNEEPHSPSPWEREWGSRNRDWDKDYALIFSTGKQDGLTCIYEIMSITPPQAPYGDNFQRYSILVMEVECSE
nr:hypothetical protein Iba_chr12fCG11430 [Ipomoea batatas]